jgi:hypothetical protein
MNSGAKRRGSSDTTAYSLPTMGRTECVVAVVAVGLVLTGYLLIAGQTGALGVARNDDWSYLQNAFAMSSSGHVAVQGYVSMMLVVQIIIAQPVIAVFGNSIVALQVLVLAFGGIFLYSSYWFIRKFLSVALSTVAVGLVAIGPVFPSIATSFMTDVPAAALQLLTLSFGFLAMRDRPISVPWTIATFLAGVLAFGIREFALAALGAVVVMLILRREFSGPQKWFLVAMVSLAGLACMGLFVWRSGQETFPPTSVGLNLRGVAGDLQIPLTLGALLLPIALFLNPFKVLGRAWRRHRRITVVTVAFTAVSIGATGVSLRGNYLGADVSYSTTVAGGPVTIFPPIVWVVFLLAAAYSTIVLAVSFMSFVTEHLNRYRGVGARVRLNSDQSILGIELSLGLICITLLGLLGIRVFARVPLFDRNLIVVFPLIAGIVLADASANSLFWARRGRAIVAMGVVSVLAMSVLIVYSTAAVDGAKWRLAELIARERGYALGQVDGGLEWYSMHSDQASGVRTSEESWSAWTSERLTSVCATVVYSGRPRVSTSDDNDDADQRRLSESIPKFPWFGDSATQVELAVVDGPDKC